MMHRMIRLLTLAFLALALMLGTAHADVALPADLTAIGDEAYLNDFKLFGTLSVPDGVSSIGASAFEGCTGLTGLVLPDSVQSIGTRAFADCTGLSGTLWISADVALAQDAFAGCTSLDVVVFTPVRCFTYTNTGSAILIDRYNGGSEFADVVIPPVIDGLPVMTIQAQAFSGCTDIASVTVPASVSYIGAAAFNRCTGLRSVALPEGLLHLDVNAFSGCSALTEVTLPASLATVGGNPFPACTGLTQISLAEGNTAFRIADGLLLSSQGVLHSYPQGLARTALTLPAGTVAIDGFAFTNDANLTTVALPDTLVSIESMAFSGCAALTDVYVPRTVTDLQQNAFMSCPNLVLTVHSGSAAEAFAIRWSIPYVVLTTPASAFTYTNTGSAILIDGLADTTLTELVIPATIEGLPVVMIRPNAFKGAAITTAVVPEGVTYIGSNAFQNCKALETVSLPDSLLNIDVNAFSGCAALQSIHIPKGVTNMSGNPFGSCTNLREITVAAENPAFRAEGSLLMTTAGKLVCYPQGLTASEVTLPSGVTTIANGAFTNISAVQTLVLPDTVTAIETQAFLCCMNLRTVAVPRSVTTIGSSAFVVCPNVTLIVHAGSAAHTWARSTNTRHELITTPASALRYTNTGSAIMISGLNDTTLTELVIPETIEGLPVVMIQPQSFRGAAITLAVIPEGVTYIGNSAFQDCRSLASVTFPSTLSHIDVNAFSGCSALTSVTLPASLASVSGNPFPTCNSLSTIILDTANTAFHVVDGMLITANGKLICYPNGLDATTVEVPEDVVCIGNGAFTNHATLETIILPDSVTAIEMQAFLCCPNLKSVVIPSSVTTIASSAAVICPNMVWTVDPGSAAETYAKNNSIPYVTSTPPATDASYLYYTVTDGAITLSGVTIPEDAGITEVVIPAEIDGIPVTALASDFNLWNAKATETLILPGSIKTIPNICNWFQNSLTTVIIGEGTEIIEAGAFQGAGMTTVVLPSTLTTIGADAFKMCGSLTTVNIPAGVTSIGSGAFVWGNSGITLTVTEGSAGHTYAVSNGLGYVIE